MEQNKDTRTGFYVVVRGTNIRWKVKDKPTLICDTKDIAQKHIDDDIAYRKESSIRPGKHWVPISIAEYNKRYVMEGE